MKKLKLLLTALLVAYMSSYAQSRVTPFEIHHRDQSTNWEFVSVGGDEVPYLYFYFNTETDPRRKLTKLTISNGWKDRFIVLTTGVYTRNESGIRWRAYDRENVNCTLEIVARKQDDRKYTQLYIRYTNIEYVYSFIIE